MLRRKSLLLTAVLACSANLNAATGVLLDSEPGDYIGAGQQLSENSVQASGNASHLQFSFAGYTADFVAPRGMTLTTGKSFSGATRYPFNSPTQPGIDVSGNGRGCNQITGWFEVREALYGANGELGRLAIDFKQHCEGGPAALYGAIRYNSNLPLELPKLAAIAGAAQAVMGREVVVLDGSGSFVSNAGATPTFRWTQLSGTPVTLNGANTNLVDFVAPLVPPGGEQLVFELKLGSNVSNQTDTDTVVVSVGSKTDPQTYLQFESEAGDYIGGGRTFRLSPAHGDITMQRNYRGGASLFFDGDTFWMLDFGPANGTSFVAGRYQNAQRFAFADPGAPGLDVGGDGRGCNTVTGEFTVLDVLATDSSIARLALDYEQHCEGGAAALRGKVRWNYIEPGAPSANAGADQTVDERASVVLNGGASTDDQAIASYRWQQISGPTVSLHGADAASTSFTAPAVSQTETLQFQLLVADGNDLTAADSVSVTVNSTGNAGEDSGSGSGGGGSFAPAIFALLLLLVRRKVKSH